MTRIILPAQINADGLLPFVAQMSDPVDQEITLDFTNLRRVTPAGLVTLTATVMRWRKEHRAVLFHGLDTCAITDYLQRMDLLKVCCIDLPESFQRRASRGRFVPVRLVDHRVDEMGNEMVACIAPGGDDFGHPMADLYDLAWYVLTETANNVRQHSAGLGYAAAQVTHAEGMVRLAIADNGMGIKGSFDLAGTRWSREADDATAIRRALEPLMSSKPNDPNQGVGLTLVSGLARLTKAWLLIVSGTGVLRINRGEEPEMSLLPKGGVYHGTLIAASFPKAEIQNYPLLLESAKEQAGLLRSRRIPGRFTP